MPGPICKHIYNSGAPEFSHAAAAAIRDSEARGLMKPERAAMLFDRMAEIETEFYRRIRDEVVCEMVNDGLVSPKIWDVWAGPKPA